MEEILWELFEDTGDIDIYLLYKNSHEQQQVSDAEQKDQADSDMVM